MESFSFLTRKIGVWVMLPMFVLFLWCIMSLALSSVVFAHHEGLDITQIIQRLPSSMAAEVSQIPEQPHFVQGLKQSTDEWEIYLERQKLVQTRSLFYDAFPPGIIDKSRPDYLARGNTEAHTVFSIGGKNVTTVFTHHHVTEEQFYTFRSMMGEVNLATFSPLFRKYETQWAIGQITMAQWSDVQRVLGWAQFEAVREFVRNALEWGLNKNLRDYNDDIQLTAGVLANRSVSLDDPTYADRLDDPVEGSAGLTVRDSILVPLTRPEDFLPDLLIAGPLGFMGGIANWKTPAMERIVFLDLQGLAYSYIGGTYNVVAHELVHTNPYLQQLPMGLYYDIEMWADLTTGLTEGIGAYLFHPYLADVRDLAKIFFGYDFAEARRRIWPGPRRWQVRDVREREFRAHAAEVKRIRDEMISFIKEPVSGLMAKFFEDPYFWMTVNTKFCNTAAAFRVLFALRYEAAGLYDPEQRDKEGRVIPPVLQTKSWLLKEDEAGRLKRLAEKAMERTNKETGFGQELSKAGDFRGMTKCPVHSRWFLMTETEQHEFENIVRPLAERAKEGDRDAILALGRIFSGSGGLTLPTTGR